MKSRLNAMRRSRSCRISKAARYSRVQRRSKTVPSRSNSAIASFEGPFGAFRNYYEPITQDLQSHLSECTLPDSQPTSSALLMLDGSTVSKDTAVAPPKPQVSRMNCPFCQQPTTNRITIQRTLQLSCGDTCHEICLFELLERPLYSVPPTCPKCCAVLVLDPRAGIDPSKI